MGRSVWGGSKPAGTEGTKGFFFFSFGFGCSSSSATDPFGWGVVPSTPPTGLSPHLASDWWTRDPPRDRWEGDLAPTVPIPRFHPVETGTPSLSNLDPHRMDLLRLRLVLGSLPIHPSPAIPGVVDLVGSRPRPPGEGSPLNPHVHWTSWDPTGSNAPFDRCSCSLAAASIAAHFPRPKRHADRRLRTHEGRPSHCQPQERNQTRQRRRARRREGSICGRSGKAQVDRAQARSQHAVAHLRWKHRWTAQKGTGERKSGVERKERRKTKEGTTDPRTGRTRETAPRAKTKDREWPGGFDW